MNFSSIINKKNRHIKLRQINHNLKLENLSKKELLVLIKKLTIHFQNELQLNENDVVLSLIENSIEWIACDFAIVNCGAIHTPIIPTSSISKIAEIAEKLKAKSIITCNPIIYEIYRNSLIDYNIIFLDFDEITKNQIKNFKPIKINDLEFFFLTSGTTGYVKIVRHPQTFLLENIYATVHFYNFKAEMTALSILPIQYAFERMYQYVFLASGLHICYAAPHWSILKNFLKFKPDICCLVPALLENLLDEGANSMDFKDYVQLKKPVIICSGGTIGIILREKIKTYKISVWEMYGSTESLIVAATTNKVIKEGSSGKLIEESRSFIKKGTLHVQTGMIGYHKKFQVTKNFKNGILNSFDKAKIENGFLYLNGRLNINKKTKRGLFVNVIDLENQLKYHLKYNDIIIDVHDGCIVCLIAIENSKSKELLLSEFVNFVNQLPTNEKIEKLGFTNIWSIKTGELTISLKPKRCFIIQKNIDSLKDIVVYN